ncbi:MAG: phosphate acyltransferase PlsX [Chloroflexi bacterium]|nr:phosphate acyltransferase PlsX [Chloroflexota bacterium]
MRIAVDAMGGDHAPREVVEGAIRAAGEFGVEIILVGPASVIESELSKRVGRDSRIALVNAGQYLVEGEHPAYALRQKRDASILVATRMVKEGKADAVVSCGPTGGVVASALQVLGTLGGVSRPMFGGNFLGFAPRTVVIDMGGNVDCRPEMLLDFAVVGAVFARRMLDIPNPTVALLSTGAEKGKGNTQVLESYPLFERSGLNFIGNVEGCDIPSGKANVIVCDGFVGNILVKYTETLGRAVCSYLEDQLRTKLSSRELQALVDGVLAATNIVDVRGGDALLAVNGVVCKGHGRSLRQDVTKTIGRAKLAVERDLVGAIGKALAEVRDKLALPGAR